ncbi:MAG: TolB family protein, partial [Planctomycetota bacterium]
VATGGAEATGGDSGFPCISLDGRVVAFTSGASNLVAGDTNGADDAFVHDLATGATTRVSLTEAGAEIAIGCLLKPVMSGEGRFVAFASVDSGVVSGDTNGFGDVFIRDRTNGTTTRVNLTGAGAQQTVNFALAAAFSSDGRYICILTDDPAFAGDDSNGVLDVIVTPR